MPALEAERRGGKEGASRGGRGIRDNGAERGEGKGEREKEE